MSADVDGASVFFTERKILCRNPKFYARESSFCLRRTAFVLHFCCATSRVVLTMRRRRTTFAAAFAKNNERRKKKKAQK